MGEPIHVPSERGRAALAELDEAAWATLGHAYGRGSKVRTSRVRVPATGAVIERASPTPFASLRALAEDPDAVYSLAGCICHQGSLYASTAAAVPFLCAYAADPAAPGRVDVVQLLLAVWIGVAWAPDEPTSARVREATLASRAHLDAIAAEGDAIGHAARLCLELASAELPDDAEARIGVARDALVDA